MSAPSPECARLAAELRLLRERSGLSLAALAEESSYSKSSWQRYLRATALPPWLAVRALCHLAEEPEPRIRALWELAESAWSRRGSTESPRAHRDAAPPPVGDPPAPAPVARERPRRRPRPRAARAVPFAGGLAACAALAWIGAWVIGGRSSVSPDIAASFHVSCAGTACDGRDPEEMLCGVEPQTLLHLVTPSGTGLEIRYNAQCRAAWARVWNTRLGDRLTLSEPGRPAQIVTIDDPSSLNAFVYTPLLGAPERGAALTACLTTAPTRASACWTVRVP